MFNPARACNLLVGLPAVNVLDIAERLPGRLEVSIESVLTDRSCPNCGERAWVKDRPVVELADLTCFGRPVRLRWRKHRLWCPKAWCRQDSWTHEDARIAAPRLSLTDRAGRWATVQVGRNGRTVSEVAAELGAGWHAVNDAVLTYGQALLDADTGPGRDRGSARGRRGLVRPAVSAADTGVVDLDRRCRCREAGSFR